MSATTPVFAHLPPGLWSLCGLRYGRSNLVEKRTSLRIKTFQRKPANHQGVEDL